MSEHLRQALSESSSEFLQELQTFCGSHWPSDEQLQGSNQSIIDTCQELLDEKTSWAYNEGLCTAEEAARMYAGDQLP